MEKTKEQISNYLTTHRKMTLATVSQEGSPMGHTVEYVSKGTVVFFATQKATRKVRNIMHNHKVAYTVDEDYDDWMAIQGVQMQGTASIVEDEDEAGDVFAMYVKKFPFVANFPPNPNLIFIKVVPQSAFFLDYKKGFTHRDAVTF